MHVTILTDDARRGALLGETILTTLSWARIEVRGLGQAREPAPAGCLVVDRHESDSSGLDLLRIVRGTGYRGALVLVVGAPDDLVRRDAAALGARCAPDAELPMTLPAAIAEATAGPDPDSSEAMRQLRRTQKLLAAGAVASRLQHSLNNPLAALLAEAQLLELEPLAEEHREAVARIVELCRRVIALVRQLDGMAQQSGGGAA